jgi:hypothetical protein
MTALESLIAALLIVLASVAIGFSVGYAMGQRDCAVAKPAQSKFIRTGAHPALSEFRGARREREREYESCMASCSGICRVNG